VRWLGVGAHHSRLPKARHRLVCSLSHGENRGSSPLGSANDFKDLADQPNKPCNSRVISEGRAAAKLLSPYGRRDHAAHSLSETDLPEPVEMPKTSLRKCRYDEKARRTRGRLGDLTLIHDGYSTSRSLDGS
jgi:hypothetical protein